MICTRRTSDWHGNAFTLSLIGYTSTCEIAVRNSDWLYRLFSNVKIKRIDLYKWALWNKILVLYVIKSYIETSGTWNETKRFFADSQLNVTVKLTCTFKSFSDRPLGNPTIRWDRNKNFISLFPRPLISVHPADLPHWWRVFPLALTTGTATQTY